MLTKSQISKQTDRRLIIQAYSIFQNSQNYQQKSNIFKKKIQNGDHYAIRTIINAIKNILTYRIIATVNDIAKIQKFNENKIAQEQQTCINLTEFSKLLALRFVRQTYFQSNYIFMSYANLQLANIMLKIGLFKKQSSDEERGRFIFTTENNLFQKLYKQPLALKNDKQIEVIGFSIHKITLEMLFTCGQLTHFLPFHELCVEKLQETQSERFLNNFYSAYLKLQQQNVMFPTKFHYFKDKDAEKYTNSYQKINFNDKIYRFFIEIFDQVWNIIHSIINSDDFDSSNLYIYLLTFTSVSSSHLNQKLLFCSKLVLETCERYFWKHFCDFFQNKLSELKNFIELDESLTQKQLKEILALHFFLIIFSFHLLEPQIMYLIQHKFIQELARLFLVVLKFYGKLCQIKESQAYKLTKKTKPLALQGNVSSAEALRCIIFCFRQIKQFSIQFTHQFHEKQSINHNYPYISLYSDIILQVQLASNKKMISTSEYKNKLQRNIIQRMSNNHELFFKKQEFVFVHYEKYSLSSHNTKQIKQNYKQSVQILLNKYHKHINIVQLNETCPLAQYVNVQKQQVQKEDILIIPIKSTDRSIRSRFSYRLNVTGSEKRFYSQDKESLELNSEKLPSIKSAINSPLSFIKSLQINVSKPNEILVKSLSSSRKLKKIQSGSKSHIKSYSQNELSQYSHTIPAQKQNNGNALPLFNTPPQFKQVFVQNYDPPVFEKSAQSISNPLKRSMKRLHKINRSNQIVSAKYINNFIKEDKHHLTQEKKLQAESLSPVSRIRESQTQSHEYQSKKIQKKLGIDSYSIECEQEIQTKLAYVQSVKQFQRQQMEQRNQIIKEQPQPQQISHSLDTMCFYYTPKAKKQLLKKKVLIKKQGHVQIGMIVNLQEDIVAFENTTSKRYMLSIKIYVTVILPMAKVNVNIKFPNWLQCISKGNLSKQNLKEQSQFISNFILQIKSNRQKIIKRNYGELPILNVVYVDRNDKKEVISEPLYILLNRFSIEKKYTQEDLSGFIEQDNKIMMPFMVHERITTDIKGMKQYFSSLAVFDLDPSEKMRLFASLQMTTNDHIGIVKLQYTKNNQQLMLIFLEGAQTNLTSHGKLKLYVQFYPLRRQQWNYEQLHIFQTCLRSILSSD